MSPTGPGAAATARTIDLEEGGHARILLVEDNPLNVELARSVLARGGYHDVRVATDGATALRLAREELPSLVLLDLTLPDTSGLDVLRELRGRTASHARLPVVVLTADGTSETRREALDRGATDHLVKPLDARDLLLRVRNHLTTHRLDAELRQQRAALQRTVASQRAHMVTLERALLASADPVLLVVGDLVVFENEAARSSGLTERWHQGHEVCRTGGTWTTADGHVVELRQEVVDDGRATLLVGRDVTERVRANRRLERLDRARGLFLAAVSHELRTPLTVLMGSAETLLEHGDRVDDDVRTHLLERIVGRGQELTGMLTDLLDLHLSERGRIRVNAEDLDVGALVRARVEDHPVAVEHQVTTALASIRASVDRELLGRVVDNLLANVRRHTPSGTPCHVEVDGDDEVVWLVVSDDGAGIPDEERGDVLAPFQHGEITDVHAPGLGIGLTLVAAIVDAHGGSVHVDEGPRGGALVRVELPRRRPVRD